MPKIKNQSGSAIPARSFVRATGPAVFEQGDWYVTVEKPNADSESGDGVHYVTGPREIPSGERGFAYGPEEGEVWVKHDPADAPDADGSEEWGPVEDEWFAGSDGRGWRIIGKKSSLDLALVRQVSASGSGGVQIIRFRISDQIDCDNCAANAEVLARPEGVSAVEDEDEYTNIVRVVDFTGCWLTDPPDDLVGRVGYAARLSGSRPLSCEPEPGEDQYGRTRTRWEIMYLCPPENTCGAAFEF